MIRRDSTLKNTKKTVQFLRTTSTLLWTCVGAFFFAIVLGVIWLKWRVQREYPFLMVFWMAPGG